MNTELEPGMVLMAPPDADTGHSATTYVLLTDPTAPMVRLCPAGEDAGGDMCETPDVVTVAREDLAGWAPLPGVLLPWPRPRD